MLLNFQYTTLLVFTSTCKLLTRLKFSNNIIIIIIIINNIIIIIIKKPEHIECFLNIVSADDRVWSGINRTF